MNNIEKEILKVVEKTDYQKGLNYEEEKIKYVGKTEIDHQKQYQFLVTSEETYRKYVVQIIISKNQIQDTFCTCPQFKSFHSCKHVAACLTCYSEKLFAMKNINSITEKTQKLFQKFAQVFEEETGKKEEVFVIPYFTKVSSYYYNAVVLKVKIGQEKMYSLISKYTSFRSSFRNNQKYSFGVNFTYDPKLHFFSESSLKLFEILDGLFLRRYADGNSVVLDDTAVKKIIKAFPNEIHINENEYPSSFQEGFPFPIKLSKDKGMYDLKIDKEDKSLEILTDDLEYVLLENTIYHLNSKQRFLLKECVNNNMDELVFSESEFPTFQKTLLRAVKDTIQFDETTNDIIMITKPEVRLYFDLNEEDITCIPKFIYKDEEISYFENRENIIRDIEHENKIIEELKEYGFQKDSNEFVLLDFDAICDFMDGGLEQLSVKYPVFTSEKLKNTNILKKNTVGGHFSIGKDQILHYDFTLEGVDEKELDNILTSLKGKKKYYRLKDGNILSLEQESLKELEELTTEMELSGHGEIPKYRALYLDSLRENKYKIIETDSLFQEFIHQFKEFQNVEIEFTKEEKKTLRDYQIAGVKWLYTICKCGFGGILADEMGLGKSLQTLIFLRHLKEEEKDAKFLIICPTSLVYNWENEILKFTPELTYHVFAGARNERRDKLKNFTGSIYITSYGLLREDLEIYQEKQFRVCIIDEAQNIKNPKTGLAKAVKSIVSETKMALTGTPIENSIVELWSIFDFIMPGFLSNLMKFQQKYKIKDTFDEETNELLHNLKIQIQPFILRRKKKDVVKDLPDKIENNISIDLTEEQKKIYAAEVKYANDEMTKYINQGGFTKNKMIILSLLTRLRQICIDPSIIIENYQGGSAKIENLIKIIKEVVLNGHKILLFTSFKTALEIVKKELEKENISSYTIAGDVPSKQRQMLVDSFNKDNTNVFLIMLKSGGTGLNLTSADVVIHLDLWWNPQAENQATDRTHRIGQTKTVEVIKLICKGTIEEKILKLQEKKKVLSDKMIEKDMDDNTILKNLTEKDIRDLLAYENKD